jgi:hypothetical protein
LSLTFRGGEQTKLLRLDLVAGHEKVSPSLRRSGYVQAGPNFFGETRPNGKWPVSIFSNVLNQSCEPELHNFSPPVSNKKKMDS